jgi:Fe-S-cluster-containing dehydrogenase component
MGGKRLTEQPCEHCGAPFIPRVTRRQRFCSRACTDNFQRKPRRPLAERFWEKVEKTQGCWLWRGAISGRLGYGYIGDGQRVLRAHRVCHHCDNPKCVRPEHLFAGTLRDNTQDMLAKGRHRCA